MANDLILVHEFMASAHEIEEEKIDIAEGEVPHERMAGFTMEQIMSGTGLGRTRIRQAMLAAEHGFVHSEHKMGTKYALKDHAVRHNLKAHKPGLDFREE